jgi:hypothetical protein
MRLCLKQVYKINSNMNTHKQFKYNYILVMFHSKPDLLRPLVAIIMGYQYITSLQCVFLLLGLCDKHKILVHI